MELNQRTPYMSFNWKLCWVLRLQGYFVGTHPFIKVTGATEEACILSRDKIEAMGFLTLIVDEWPVSFFSLQLVFPSPSSSCVCHCLDLLTEKSHVHLQHQIKMLCFYRLKGTPQVLASRHFHSLNFTTFKVFDIWHYHICSFSNLICSTLYNWYNILRTR